jgi:hypothetical protein
MKRGHEDTRKRPYTAPRLTAHGTLEEITKRPEKEHGPTDGIAFKAPKILTVS